MPESEVHFLHERREADQSGWSVMCTDVFVSKGNSNVIAGVSCRISDVEVSIIMGPNGAGKSMLLRTIAGLVKPNSGYVQLHPRLAGKTALVFQQPVVLRRSVRGNLDHALRISGLHRGARSARIEELLEIGGLKGVAEQQARTLSGGEKQRLQVVRALASSPNLLLMDEPTANLDPQSTMALETLIRTTADSGVKIVIVTHDVGQARRLADEVIFLHKGRVVEQKSASRLLYSPKSREVKLYLEGRLLV